MAKKITSWFLLTVMLSFSNLPLQAAMVSTEQVVMQQQASLDRDQLNAMFDRVDVQQQMVALGVSVDEVQKRVAMMTDAEVAQLNQQMSELPAGASVLSLAVLIFIVFVVTDVIGATDIFPFIKPVR